MGHSGCGVAMAVLMWLIGFFANTAGAQVTPEVIDGAKKEGEVMLYGAVTRNPA